jgi:hypothetical protein
VSIIKDDGTVVDIKNGDVNNSQTVEFTNDGKIAAQLYHDARAIRIFTLPTSDVTQGNHYTKGYALEWYESYYLATGTQIGDLRLLTTYEAVGNPSPTRFLTNNNMSISSTSGLNLIKRNTTTPSKGSVAYITSKYNTGYMTGDIRGAWNVDTDVTSFTTLPYADGGLIYNGGFGDGSTFPDADGWGQWKNESTGTGTASLSGNVLTLTRTDSNNRGRVRQYWTAVEGRKYHIIFKITQGGAQVHINNNQYFDGINWNSIGVGTHTATVTADGTTMGIDFMAISSGTHIIDDVFIREAIPDRSVKGNGLAVHGTPTVSAVATGAELKYIKSFSTSNYLFIDKNTIDVNWSNAWSMMFWQPELNCNIGIETGVSTSAYNTSVFAWLSESNGQYHPRSLYYSNESETSGAGKFVTIVYDGSGGWTIYIDGIQATTRTGTITLGLNTCNVNVGRHSYNGVYTTYSGAIALLRISQTAPTAEQIKEIYEAEKPLFQDNAKCTLNGTSDAVTAMSYDDSNEELLVGTSGGLSVFKGLRRVDENTNNISEVAQQGGLRVEEY